MSKVAYSADGVSHTFPDDTPDSVIDRVMLDYAKSKSATAKPAGPKLGTYQNPIEWTPETAKTIKPLEHFRYKGKTYIHQPGAGMPGATKAAEAPDTGGAIGATFRAATREAIPALAGALPGAGMGAGVGGALGLTAGFGIPALEAVTVPVGVVGGGIIGGAIGRDAVLKLAEKPMSYVPDSVLKIIGQDKAQREADVARHNLATNVGAAMPGFFAGRPSVKANLPSISLRGGLRVNTPPLDLRVNVPETALGAAVGSGTELMRQGYSGVYDPASILAMGAVGAAQARPTRFSNLFYGEREGALDRAARETIQPKGQRSQRGRAEASADMRRTKGTLQEVGIPARPIDVMDKTTTAEMVRPTSAASDEAVRLLSKYREDVQGPGPESTQAGAQRAAEAIEPSVPQTAKQMEAEANAQITAAGESVQPGVKLGEASADIARKLAGQKVQEKDALRAGYEDQAATGVATVLMPRPGESPWQPITAKQAQQYAKGMVNDPRDPLMINTQTTEVVPRSKLGPQNVAEFNAELRDPISGFMEDPDSIKPVLNVLNDLEKQSLSSLDTTNLIGARKRLSAIERDFGGSPSGAAAGRVRRKLDEILGVWSDNDRFSGPAEVVDKMRANTAQAREFYKNWESGDIAQTLTETQMGRNGRETVLDPEAARNVIFGALKDTNKSLKNMKVLRDRLGADSPEWNALRQEAVEQLIGGKTDKGSFITKLEDFERKNPAMAEILFTPAERAQFASAKTQVEKANVVKGGLTVGGLTLSDVPKDFDTAVNALTPSALRAAKVALRSLLQQRLGTPKGATSLLSDLANGTLSRENVTRLLGATEADTLFRRAEVLAAREKKAVHADAAAENARAGTSLDPEIVRTAERASTGLPFLTPLTRFLTSRGMDREVALRTVQDALDPAKTDEVIAKLEQLYGETAAQAFLRRVRASVSGSQSLGTIPRRISERAAIAGGMTSAEPKDEEPKDEAPPVIGEEPPPQAERDKEFLDFLGIPDTAEPSAKNEDTSGAPLGVRNNNPGNMKAAYIGAKGVTVTSPFVEKLPGYKGYDDNGFAIFDTMENGIAAQERLLERNYGGLTINQIVEKYAPAEENPPEVRRNYKAYLAKELGIAVGDVPRDLSALAAAIRRFETGRR